MSTDNTVFTRRIMGIETEFGITCTHDGIQSVAPDDIARQLFHPIIERFRSSNIYTHNGGRLYLDVGSHPEYATPECDNLSQLLIYDRAGEATLNRLADQAEQVLVEQHIDGSIHLFKNNTDSLGNSYGCHENYLVGRQMPLQQLGQEFIPFLITRQLICGAGHIVGPQSRGAHNDSGPSYQLSQRANHVWEGVSSATTRSRPIINTRDEPHADSELYRRLHVIVGDTSMSETTAALKVGSALLVLEMLEAGYTFDTWEIANPPQAIRDISYDLTGRAPIVLRSGRVSCALQVQCAFLESAQRWLHERPGDHRGTSNAEMQRVVTMWKKVLTAIDAGDTTQIVTDIDWAIKKDIIDRYQDKFGWDLCHPKLQQIDFAYHDIRPGKGIFRTLERNGRVSRWLPEADSTVIAEAVNTPPHTTRAKIRGDFLRLAHEYDADVSVDWTRLKVNRPGPRDIALTDPFTAHDPRAEELILTILNQ
ncbi:Pup--protein ligase [Corynebacterium kroppenstedtii]